MSDGQAVPPPPHPLIECADPERAISVLEGWAVVVTTADGAEFTGMLTQFVPQDGTRTMIQIRETITDELIMATDIRNLTRIEVL